MNKRNTIATREEWLTTATTMLDDKFFKSEGYDMPEKVRVSVGFPRGSSKAIGQCYDNKVSEDGTYEIFICPTQAAPVRVLDILLHELIHAVVGIEEGHKGMFRKLAKEVGLAGKMTATVAEEGTEIYRTLEVIAGRLGPFPHAPLQKKMQAAKPNKWVRYYSTTEEKFRVVINCDRVEEFGVPHDPWGQPMMLST